MSLIKILMFVIFLSVSTQVRSETLLSPLKWNHELQVTRVATNGRILATQILGAPSTGPTHTRYFVAFQVDVPIGSCIEAITGQMQTSKVYNGRYYQQLSPIGVNWYAPPSNVCNQNVRSTIKTVEMQTTLEVFPYSNVPRPTTSTKRIVINRSTVGPEVYDVILDLSIPSSPRVTLVRIGNP